ncbi:KOW motif-containing protein [Thiospirochaeta perfilievii]|uniref:KOW motif-containing protein n=1 Tax=Thiospirochaeta perfilievii TaxID=252967 RepID=UPI003CCC47D7
MFPGYIFLKTKENIDNVTLQLLKDTKNVVKILNSYKDPIPLCCNQLDLIKPLLNPNFKAELSNVNFNKDDKIVVINGPLKELEGQIIKVDKRKQRVTVQIEMYNKVHKINFSYIDISK